jgi:hypothetical protein
MFIPATLCIYLIVQGDEDLRRSVQFVACGDLSDGDPDANYDLDPQQYIRREAVQPPTAPAYKTAIEQSRRQDKGG